MIAIPAVDLRGGACVQLVGGDYGSERIRDDDPVGVARRWERIGFQRLHLVDLDAATQRGTNAPLVRELVREVSSEVQVGGGLREREAIERLLDDGARRVMVGTRAIEDPDWLAELAHDFPDEIIVAADVRDRKVVTRGWQRTLPHDIVDLVAELSQLPLAGILVTAVHKEGRLQGTDLPLMEDVAEASAIPLLASGGITTIADLRALDERGVAAAVLGMALYTGALDARFVAEEFCE